MELTGDESLKDLSERKRVSRADGLKMAIERAEKDEKYVTATAASDKKPLPTETKLMVMCEAKAHTRNFLGSTELSNGNDELAGIRR